MKAFRYGSDNRPPGIGTVPKGALRYEPHPEFRWGVAVYDRPLDESELRDFELFYAAPAESVPDVVQGLVLDMLRMGVVEAALDLVDEDMHLFEMAVGQQLEQQRLRVPGGRAAIAPLVLAELRRSKERT